MHEYTSISRVWSLSCPGSPEEVSRVRRWTRDILRGSPMADDAELIVSELSANAILHTASGQGCGSFHLTVTISPKVIALSVTDEGGTNTAPKVEHPEESAVGGRGLDIVNALAHLVVVNDSQNGHTITAQFFVDNSNINEPTT